MANTTDTPANTPGNTTGDTPANTPGDALGELTAAIEAALDQGLPCVVELYQVTASGRVPISKIDGDKFDAFDLGVKPGKYMARAKINGKYAKSATIIVDGPGSGVAANPIPQQSSTAPQGFDSSTLLGMMMQQAQSAQQQMMTLFTSSQQQMTTLLTTVLANKAEDKSKVSEIVEAVGKIHELAPGGEKSELGELAEVFAPIIAAAAANKGGDETITLTKEQAARIKAKLAAAKQRPQLAAQKPAAVVESKPKPAPQAPPNTPKQTVTIAQPGEAAAVSLPAFVPEVARRAIEKLVGCYVLGISSAAAGVAMFDLLDQSPEGAQFSGEILGADAKAFAQQLGKSVPQFASPIGEKYATEALEELQQLTREATEEEIGLSDETDEVNSGEESADAEAA